MHACTYHIAQLLGLPLIPAYSEAIGDQVLRGVNYASAAAGILPDTGGNFVSCMQLFTFCCKNYIYIYIYIYEVNL